MYFYLFVGEYLVQVCTNLVRRCRKLKGIFISAPPSILCLAPSYAYLNPHTTLEKNLHFHLHRGLCGPR